MPKKAAPLHEGPALLSRRAAVTGLGALALSEPLHAQATTAADPVPGPGGRDPGDLARDEAFWGRVAQHYEVSSEFINLENGYYGIMASPVQRAHRANADRLNRLNSHLLRGTYKQEAEDIRQRIASLAGVRPEEIALTRGGTEALQNLIGGYNRLRPGDAVMYSDLDYYSARYAMNWLRDRRGVQVKRITIPEPATREAVLDTYVQALHRHPQTKLLLLSHMNNVTGLVTPVREIVAVARKKGVDVIVDAAHSWGQLDFTIPGLGADFAFFSLHKWIGAPLGTGFLYIRQGRVTDIDRAYADETYPATDIRSRVHSGTTDVASVLSVPAALDFHDALGGAAVKQARLRYLRDRWVHQITSLHDVEVLTPDDPSMHGAITSFRVAGRTTEADNVAIARYLLDRYRIFTVRRRGPAMGDCVRITPALFTRADDMDHLATALHDVAERFTA